MLLAHLDIHKEKNEPPSLPHTIPKNSECIINLNAKAKTIKYLEKRIGVNLYDFEV